MMVTIAKAVWRLVEVVHKDGIGTFIAAQQRIGDRTVAIVLRLKRILVLLGVCVCSPIGALRWALRLTEVLQTHGMFTIVDRRSIDNAPRITIDTGFGCLTD